MAQLPSDEIRVGDLERNRATEALRDATGVGKLQIDELDERLAAALGAKTRGDLRAVLADIMMPGDLSALLEPDAWRPSVALPGYSTDDPLELIARMEDVKRAGEWEVPPYIDARAEASNVRLDCRHARAGASVIQFLVSGALGDIVVVVPPGWAADASRVSSSMGSVKVSVPSRPEPGCPLLLFDGKLGAGDLKVRTPNRLDDWRERRRLRREERKALRRSGR